MAEMTVVRFEPRGAVAQLLTSQAPEVVLAGTAGTGNSMGALFRLHLAALQYPGIRCLIVRKTAVSLGSTTLVTFEEKVAKEALAAGITHWYGGSVREAASYRYRNGSAILVGGLDKPEKIMSSDFDLIFCDEATEFTETDWETLGTRLRHGKLPWQQQIAACNPNHPRHWIAQRASRGVLLKLTSRHADNPAYVNTDGTYTPLGAGYMAKLGALTGVRRERLYRGRWSAAEGAVYEEGWDDAVHLADGFTVPAEWTRWWSVDFGYTNPFVLQCWAEDGDGRVYLYREIYRTRRLVEDHARDILAVVAPGGEWAEPRPRAVICDHDAEDRATLERHLGMSTVPARKSVSDGIEAVQTRLKAQADGRPRLFICRDALVRRDEALADAAKPLCTADEIPGYVWDMRAIPGGGNIREAPVKEDDHGCDAMRYFVAQLDLIGRPGIRSFDGRGIPRRRRIISV